MARLLCVDGARPRRRHRHRLPLGKTEMTKIDAPLVTGLTVHPGEYLAEEFLEPLGLSMRRAATALNISAANLSRFVAGKQSVSTELAVRLAAAFGTSAQFWLNLQQAYDLAQLRAGRWSDIEAEVERLSA
ncbi:MAG: addiction module antidote protein, HigA family [Oceanicaulis sp.]|nr:addiction module antidote protein, HigA family [Oceanicaulis sp.]